MDTITTITEFKHLLQARGYAPATIEAYWRDIKQFRDYLLKRSIVDMRKATREVVLDYQERVNKQPVATETKALKIRAVKRLFERLVETNRLLINPTEGLVETSRVNRPVGTVLSIAEIQALLSQPNLSFSMQIRDRAIMEVLYASGIRHDELLRLEVYDADLKEGTLFIRRGKGKKQRVVPIGKHATCRLKEYLEKIRPRSARLNPRVRTLFLDRSGRPISAMAVRAFLRIYRQRAGINKPVSVHTFRRTCATHLLQQGADIRYVQKLLGHKHLKTTQQYTKVAAVDIKKTHRNTHPNEEGRA